MSSDYDDIINLSRPEPIVPPMSMESRGAQFAPFAALSGHDDAIAESGRLTQFFCELSDDEHTALARRLNFYLALPSPGPIDITYFRPDPAKEGGEFVVLKNVVIQKIDNTFRTITLSDKTEIDLDSVTSLDGDIFNPVS